MGSDGAKYLDDIEEDVKEDKSSDDDDDDDSDQNLDDKFDPLGKQKEGAPKLKK